MLGLRQKLILAFGGMLLILATVGAVSGALLTKYRSTIEHVFRENYDSVIYGQRMKDVVDELDDLGQMSLWKDESSVDKESVAKLFNLFEENLTREKGNVTVAGEDEIASKLKATWGDYRSKYEKIMEMKADANRRAFYQENLKQQAQVLKRLAQNVIDLNLANILSVDGEIKASAKYSRNAMSALNIASFVIAALFVTFIGRSILRPLHTVTQSAREIEKGNLDLVIQVKSHDELGKLADAFNSMTAKLREYRRSDRAKLFRVQRTTQLALNTFPDAVAIVGLDGKVELANDVAQRRFALASGVDLASTGNKMLWNLFQQVFTSMQPVHPKAYDTSIQIFHEGKEHFFLPQAVPIIAEDKTLAGVTIVLADVTELRRLDEMKSNLVSVVSHELKTPLTSIRMAAHLLLEERVGPLTEKQSELVVTARDDAERLNAIIEKLLDIGRLQSGRALMDLKPVAPEQLVSEAAERFRSAYRDRGVLLNTEIENDLPEVLADLSRIGHVFSNLLDNALKYTPSGGNVSVCAERTGDFVSISVRDSGRGIPKDALPKIFERFYRVSDQDEVKGAGLGLAIAHEIVEAHGGTLSVKSTLGEGSVFTFTLKVSEFNQLT